MTTLKFNKDQSLEEGEVIMEEDSTETFEEAVDVLETTFSTEPTAKELALAQELTGTPHSFDAASVQLLNSLCAKGIAADFGIDENGDHIYARGHKWHGYCS